MTSGRAVLGHPWLVALGWMVIVSLATTTIPALALGVWRLLRPTARALDQYRAASIAFVSAIVLAMLGGPLLLVTARTVVPTGPPAGISVRPNASTAHGRPRSAVPRDAADTVPLTTAAPARVAVAHLSPTAVGAIGLVWPVGAALLIGRLGHGWAAANRLRRRATLMDDGPLLQTFERLSAAAHAEGTSLVVSAEIEAPVAVGIHQPAVVLPAHLLDFMPCDGLAPILVHELTHVRRGDYAANLAQATIEALMFHSPAMWWMGRRIREAREYHCDDVSAEAAGDRARYVEALTLVARLGTLRHARPAVGMAGPRLITRVRRLLEGERTMSMPIVRASVVAVGLIVVTAALPQIHATASDQLATRLFASGRAAQGSDIPRGYPQRQEGSGLRIVEVLPSDAHVCGTFQVRNLTSEPVAQLRFVGVLSFKPGANRPVLIRESELLTHAIAPGATSVVQVPLLDVAEARREAGGEHVQGFCAVREVVFANRAAWSMTPNPAATTDVEALGLGRRPTLPRALVGLSRVAAYPGLTLCLDEAGGEYSTGAQVGIRDEPVKSARCAANGRWIEVDRSGEPVGESEARVAVDVMVDGLPSAVSLESAPGRVATLQLASGRTWGLVPTVAANGDVSIALHDLSTTPHTLVGTRSLPPGAAVRFEAASPLVSVRLASR